MGKLWSDAETAPFITGWRPARVVKWYDADTPKLRIDVGYDIDGVRTYVRLLAEGAVLTPDDKSDDVVDAWELRGAERALGQAAKARASELIPVGSAVRVWSFKGSGTKGKYGRWLVVILYPVREVLIPPPGGALINLDEARRGGRCRVCGKPTDDPVLSRGGVELDFGKEHAHVGCLVKNYAGTHTSDAARVGWMSLGDTLIREGHAEEHL